MDVQPGGILYHEPFIYGVKEEEGTDHEWSAPQV